MDLLLGHGPLPLLLMALGAAVVGLSKGGLSGLGVMAVPVMALAIPPVQAAAILLPLLCLSDLIALWTWRGAWDRRLLLLTLPGAMVGIGVGWATAALVSDDAVRLIVGAIALVFVLRWLWQRRGGREAPRGHSAPRGALWGGLAGYTSFVAHAGGPPYQVYAMPLGLDPRAYTGTVVVFFAVVNYVKLVPYLLLGQFDAQNLGASLLLAPVAVLFTFAGAALIRRMRAEVFYPVTYALTAAVGLKLVWDGLAGL